MLHKILNIHKAAEKHLKSRLEDSDQNDLHRKELSTKVSWNCSRFEAYIAEMNAIYQSEGNIDTCLKRNIILPSEMTLSVKSSVTKSHPKNEPLCLDISAKLIGHKIRMQFSNEDLYIFTETFKTEWESFLNFSYEFASVSMKGSEIVAILQKFYFSFSQRTVTLDMAIDEAQLVSDSLRIYLYFSTPSP